MKKVTATMIALTMALGLTACGGTTAASSTAAKEETPASSQTSQAEQEPEATAVPEEPATAAEEVDVGGPYPATTDWDEYVVTDYYFESTDETVSMLIETNTAHNKFNCLFDFYGDKQEMTYSVDGENLTVEYDLTGFIGKDVEKINTFINENVTEWQQIG